MYPGLKQRYLSTFIDGFVLLFVGVFGTISFQTENETAHLIRVAVLLTIIFSYEPVLTSQLCTVGQRLVGIRVRRHSDHFRRISVFAAYLRTITKILLGGYSIFAMAFNKERRAAHDFVVRSVVIDPEQLARINAGRPGA